MVAVQNRRIDVRGDDDGGGQLQIIAVYFCCSTYGVILVTELAQMNCEGISIDLV